MKCISLWQPWASLVVLGLKRIETRSWETLHRGQLLIHAASKWNHELDVIACREPFRSALASQLTDETGLRRCGRVMLPFGRIIGVVTVDGCEPITAGNVPMSPEREFGDYRTGQRRFLWRLSNPRMFEGDLPFRGHQQIFHVPDEMVSEQIKTAGRGVNGHFLHTPHSCGCNKEEMYPRCAVCEGGLGVCRWCGAAEVELDQPCPGYRKGAQR